MAQKFFTVEEANRLLPKLEALVATLRRKQQELLATQQALEELRARISENGHTLDRQEVGRLRQELEKLAKGVRQGITEIEAWGCLVKDLEVGLVDFPSFREGRQVYLCWRLGEEEVAFWHGLDEGFVGRKPIKGDPL